MAKTSYFQRVATRAVDSPHIQPASGLLSRWAQFADAWPTMDRKAPQSPPAVAAAHPLPSVVQTAAPSRRSRRDPVVENDAQSPGIQPTVHGPRPVAQPIRRPRDETLDLQRAPAEQAREFRTNQAAQPEAATATSVARKDPGRAPVIRVKRGEPSDPGQSLQRLVPPALPPQDQPAPRVAAATKIVRERFEHQIVMPEPPPQTATFLPPPIPKREATVEIGTIEVKVIREATPVPAVTAPPQQAGAKHASSPSAAQATPISRRMAVAHGFHQS